jgi:hypothetical protein
MNNYISLNLVNGRLGRFSGGGRPRFILGEQNNVQIYFLDYPKPSTYPTESLGDAFSEITTRDFNSSNITINAGKRGDSRIISTNTFFNLPNNFATGVNIQQEINIVRISEIQTRKQVSFSGIISLQPIPEESSLFRITSFGSGVGLAGSGTFTPQPGLPFNFSLTSPYFSFNNPSEASKIIDENISNIINNTIPELTITRSSEQYRNISQISDYSFSFQYIYLLPIFSYTDNFSVSATIDTSRATANFGKYGYLDFSSPSWDAIIGTKNEAEIWMEAMIGSDTIAQGNAIIYRKMT